MIFPTIDDSFYKGTLRTLQAEIPFYGGGGNDCQPRIYFGDVELLVGEDLCASLAGALPGEFL